MCILSCAPVPWAVSFSGPVSSDLLFRLHFLASLHRELCISVSGCTYFQISLKIILLLKSTKLPSPMYIVFHLEMWKLYPNYTLMLLAAYPYYSQCSRCFKHLQFWMQKSVFLLCSHGHCNQKWAIKYFIYIYVRKNVMLMILLPIKHYMFIFIKQLAPCMWLNSADTPKLFFNFTFETLKTVILW